jgi:ketosteroid isomerase-like protein
MVTARTPQEQLVLDFFRILSSGDLEAIRATLHPDATWRPMVEGVPGAGVHGPRDKIVDEFLAPVRGLFVPGDPKTTVDRMVSTGDTVMCESRGATPGASTCGTAESLPSASTWTVTTSRPCLAAAPDCLGEPKRS